MATRRTTHRSSTGKKLYAVRAEDGTFQDIQTYARAHAADLRRKSKAETATASKKATPKPAKPAKRAAGAKKTGAARGKSKSTRKT